ncbi:phage portal protein [Caulobacter flavus]|uniref:Phage portal protein n=1 Tax=Caulobacter flavus TaxID=1679497 RepID=A0A2N5CS09_9CAUL|nr:phage portal protein [Caulobacter flavus]AYV46480.1 phage portal protein [Caulobacter flavus]PLR12777.1 phage portal protein [Caulobacter flavus]
MALFARRRAPEIKDSRAARLVALTSGGRPQWTPRDYATLAAEGFGKNPVAYRCVRMIAEAAAAVPLAVFHDGRRSDGHPLARLLAAPNPEQGGPDLMEAFFGHLQVAGNGYLEAAGDQPGELYALRPDRMSVVPGARGWPAAYDYQAGGRTARIARDADGWLPVLHLKLFNPTSDHYGASPLEAAAFAIDVHTASGAWNKALLDNAARPSGALVYGGRDGDRLSEEQFERLKAELANAHGGTANAGRPLLLEGGLEWKPMSLTPADLDFVEGKHAAAREIALAFGVPPQLLGIPGDNTYANYREANGAFWRHTVVPLAERAARALTAWLGPKFPGARVACDLDAVPALSAERDALWARLEAASFLTDAERRRLAGLEG